MGLLQVADMHVNEPINIGSHPRRGKKKKKKLSTATRKKLANFYGGRDPSDERIKANLSKHGHHDQRTHGNRYGSGYWGGSHSGSTNMTGFAAQAMGLTGYKTYESDPGDVALGKRSALGMLRGIRDSKPRTRPLFHGEATDSERATIFKKGAKVKLPLTATTHDHFGAQMYAENRKERPNKDLLIFEFAPGTKALKYQAGEWVTAGDFIVKDVVDDEPRRHFNYERQEDVITPVKRVLLEQVAVFDPDEIGKRLLDDVLGNPITALVEKWDFDPNQPRDYRGRWTDIPGLGHAKAIGRRVGTGIAAEQHSRTPGGTGSKTLGVASAFDHATKNITVKPPRPNRGAKPTYEGFVDDSKLIDRGRALYERNNGPTAITNARLKELFMDPSKITQKERVLIASSRSAKSIDGNSVIRGIPTSRGNRDLERYDLIGQLASKFAPGSGNRSERRETGISEARRERINEKRRESGKVSSTQFGQISERISKSWSTDGKTAICVFCGKPVRLAGMSIETPKPKALGGGYSDPGNTWPAHKSCNTNAGKQAQKDPDTYYEDMMKKFKDRVPPEVKAKLPEVYKSHRKYLGTYAAAKKAGFK